jgi:hypothetical protein
MRPALESVIIPLMAVNWRRWRGRDWRLLWRARAFVRNVLFAVGVGVVALAALSLFARETIAPASSLPSAEPQARANAYYANCNAARAADEAPLFAWEPGYRRELDRDRDGIACEAQR